MVSISVGKDVVMLKLDGTKKLFALKSRIRIPIKNISKVSTEQVKPVWFPEMRLGTHVPGGFMAGTFWMRKGGKTFYYAKDFANCITLTLKNHEYARVIVEVSKDKEAVASKIRNAMQ